MPREARGTAETRGVRSRVARALLRRVAMRGNGNQTRGETGEQLACDELRRRGYAILARRYRTRGGELDIVARHGDTLVFVEVKARSSQRFGSPGEAVGWRKQRKLRHMAEDFLARAGLSLVPCRFDVVAVLLPDDGARPRVEVIEGAFEA